MGGKDRFDPELYDRRLQVYMAAHELVEQVTRDGKVNAAAMAHFEREKLRYEFLFGEKVRKHLDEVLEKAKKNFASNTVLESLDSGEPNEKFAEHADKTIEWLVNQKDKLREVFNKDMSITGD